MDAGGDRGVVQPPGTSGNCSEGKEGAASCRRGNSLWEGLSGGGGARWPGGEPGCQGLSRDHNVGGLSCYFLGLQFTLSRCQGRGGLASSAVQPHPWRACPTSHILTPTSVCPCLGLTTALLQSPPPPPPIFGPFLSPPAQPPFVRGSWKAGCDLGSPERATGPAALSAVRSVSHPSPAGRLRPRDATSPAPLQPVLRLLLALHHPGPPVSTLVRAPLAFSLSSPGAGLLADPPTLPSSSLMPLGSAPLTRASLAWSPVVLRLDLPAS